MTGYLNLIQKVKALLEIPENLIVWEKYYYDYVEKIFEKGKIIEENFRGKRFGILDKYTSFTLLKDSTNKNKATIQLRYKGIIVAEIERNRLKQCIVKPNIKVKYANWELKQTTFEWESLDGRSFRKFIKSHNPKDFYNPKYKKRELCESFVESTIIDDLTNYVLGNKIPGMNPVRIGGCSFQFPTAIAASSFHNDGEIYFCKPQDGGRIDILSRIKFSGISNTLAIVEVKDFKDKKSSTETFEKVMGQAVAYSTFILQLLRSENTNSEKWWKFFGFNSKNGIPNSLLIKTFVAMPIEDVSSDEINEVFKQRKLVVGKDIIELNYLLYDFDKNENIVTRYYNSSFDNNVKNQ